MWIEGISFFLGVSILLYCLFGGADFGAGMLEAFRGRKFREEQRETIAHAISPVWEANHMWIVQAIEILFVGFPRAYSAMSVTFHIPLTLLLLGIVIRGCAFTFRQYDAVQDQSQKYYSQAFVISSFLAPFMLGIVAGGLLLGKIAPPRYGFYPAFIAPWLNLFCFSVGFFTCVLFAFLAAVYLIGETDRPEIQKIFVRRAVGTNILAVLSGALVFVSAHLERLELTLLFTEHPYSLLAMLIATFALAPLWYSLLHQRYLWARVFAALQVTMILLGWFSLQYPYLLESRAEAAVPKIFLYEAAAPVPTLRALLGALVVGSLFIFPALFYLMKVFKLKSLLK